MDSRIVIVDPFQEQDLLELAELSGLPYTRVRAWPFEVAPADRLVSTVPIPRGAGTGVLGVVLDVAVTPRLGEVWPDRVVSLRHGREEILGFLSGADSPGGTRVGVLGLAGGIGATTFAACLARALATHPIAVALLDTDPLPGLAARLGLEGHTGVRWADLVEETGPLLPQRFHLPVWHRVRVATSDVRGAAGAPFLAAAQALSRTSDVLVIDLPRSSLAQEPWPVDHLVTVFAGSAPEIDAWSRLREMVPGVTPHPVVRTDGELSPAEVARRLGEPVIALGIERASGTVQQPGDRRRGAVMTAARLVAERVAP